MVLALASLTIMLVVVDLTAVTIALPDIRAALGAILAEVQWVVDAYALTLAALLGGCTYRTLHVRGPLEASPVEAGVRFRPSAWPRSSARSRSAGCCTAGPWAC
ncbi:MULTISPECIES: hypothetical protein [unclassified Nonomuraea]|uniref:hypothetical protein n=1 Tax=unclassified Nonomuraea TaxID=2593643 RepID=UPI0033F3A329